LLLYCLKSYKKVSVEKATEHINYKKNAFIGETVETPVNYQTETNCVDYICNLRLSACLINLVSYVLKLVNNYYFLNSSSSDD